MKKILSLLLLLLIKFHVSAQTESRNVAIARTEFQAKQVIPPSPIASELGKYGNVPVSLFTGTPNISIPLYELKGNILSLPLSLTYDASGYRPDELATWCGSSWTLNAGGVITRSVLGNPDNESNYFNCPYSIKPPSGSNSSFAAVDYMSNVRRGLIESQPDMFYFNFAGHSGKFKIKEDNSIVKKKKDMLMITSGINSYNSNFSVIDEQGTTYSFNDVEQSKLIPSDVEGAPNNIIYNYPSSWFLTRIRSADGLEQIDFEYYSTQEEQELNTNRLYNESHVYKYYYNGINCGGESSNYFKSLPPTNRVKRKFLKKITLKRGGVVIAYVDLNSSAGKREDIYYFPEDRLLEQIKAYHVVNNIPTPVKQYDFSYSYFTGTSSNVTSKLLRLDALQEFSLETPSVAKPPYRFTYNTNTQIPERFTGALDHWGFYNEHPNRSLVPNKTVWGFRENSRTFGGGANRDPDLNGSKCTMLNKIQYPTGGYSTFEYELNQAMNENMLQDVGGVRIKKITDYAFNNQISSAKNYSYLLKNGKSSGEVISMPEYLKQSSEAVFADQQFGSYRPCVDDGKHYTVFTLTASSIYGLGSIQGGHIGYSEVTESNVDNAGHTLGKTVYKYNIGSHGEYQDDIASGDLLEQSVYRSDDKLLKETINSYQYGNVGAVPTYLIKMSDQQTNKKYYCKKPDGSIVNYLGGGPPDGGPCVETRIIENVTFVYGYSFYSQSSQLVSKSEKSYDDESDTYSIQTNNYSYDNTNHIYPTKIRQTTTGNTELVTLKKYAADYTISNVPRGSLIDKASSGIMQLKSLNMGGTEIETLQYRQNPDGSEKRYVGGSLIQYNMSSLPRPERLFRLESVVPLTAVIPSQVTEGTFVYDPSYKPVGSFEYTPDGNLSTQAKENASKTSYLWNYTTLYPTASVLNADKDEIAYDSFETETETTADWINEGVTFNPSFALSGQYSAILGPGGKISKLFRSAPSRELLVSYWSRSGSISVKSNGATLVPVTRQGLNINDWTYFEHIMPLGTYMVELTAGAQAIVDELRLYPKDAQMETIAYTPQGWLSTKVSASNLVSYYDYDGFGRLVNIRDTKRQIQKNYSYNYGAGIPPIAGNRTLFYNSEAHQSFVKQNCTAGTPESITYTVPYGKYTGVSQATADALAQQEINANGQTNADAKGRCLFYSVLVSQRFFKNDCPPEQGLGQPYIDTIPAGTYAAESQAEADAMAVNDLNTNGQDRANQYGNCSCEGEGRKAVNGICERGVKIIVSSTKISTGRWQCVYKYRFSDNTYSIEYTTTSTTQCGNNN